MKGLELIAGVQLISNQMQLVAVKKNSTLGPKRC